MWPSAARIGRQETAGSRDVLHVEPAGVRKLLPHPRLLVVKDGGDTATAFSDDDMWRRALRLGHITAASALEVTGDHGPLPDGARIERLLDLPAHEWAPEG